MSRHTHTYAHTHPNGQHPHNHPAKHYRSYEILESKVAPELNGAHTHKVTHSRHHHDSAWRMKGHYEEPDGSIIKGGGID